MDGNVLNATRNGKVQRSSAIEMKDRSWKFSEIIVMAAIETILPTLDGIVSKFVLIVLNLLKTCWKPCVRMLNETAYPR